MSKFLNGFSRKAKTFNEELVKYLEELFSSFLGSCKDLDDRAFRTQGNRFSITLFESVFYAVAREPLSDRQNVIGLIDNDSVVALKTDKEFATAASRATTNSANVEKRLSLAKSIVRVT